MRSFFLDAGIELLVGEYTLAGSTGEVCRQPHEQNVSNDPYWPFALHLTALNSFYQLDFVQSQKKSVQTASCLRQQLFWRGRNHSRVWCSVNLAEVDSDWISKFRECRSCPGFLHFSDFFWDFSSFKGDSGTPVDSRRTLSCLQEQKAFAEWLVDEFDFSAMGSLFWTFDNQESRWEQMRAVQKGKWLKNKNEERKR